MGRRGAEGDGRRKRWAIEGGDVRRKRRVRREEAVEGTKMEL